MFEPVSLITGGVSLISGLFGRKKKQETTTSTSTTDLVGLRDEAVRAGYNPLTALRAGVAGGFVTTTTKGPAQGGGGGGGSAIADGIGQIAGSLFGSFNAPKNDPIKVKSKTTGEVRLVNSQLRGSTMRAGSVVVAPRETTVRSPVTSTRQGTGVRQQFGPPMPLHLKLDKPIPLYVTGIDDNGKRHRIANPDLPDLDQLVVPSSSVVLSETKAATERAPSWFDSWMYSGSKRRHPRTGQPY